MQVALRTLGCKVNQFETQAIAEQFQEQGCILVHDFETADIILINTCTVTAKAAYQSRQAINRALRENPEAIVAATGCYVQVGSTEIVDRIGPRILMIGNDMKAEAASICLFAASGTKTNFGIYIGEIRNMLRIAPLKISMPGSRARVYLKVQDGCNAFCSYCIVPYARGRSRSMPVEEVVKQVELLRDHGVREIVITGIHVGAYGADLPENPDLLRLFIRLCSGFPDLWFRLSSIEPAELTGDFLDFAASTENFCHHLHVPLQSGSGKVLRAMKRGYTPEEYRATILKIVEKMPDACIGTDVLTGFPAEGVEEFMETVNFLKDLPVSYVHAFPYSRRPGTEASGFNSLSTKKEAARRAALIREIGEEKRIAFYRQNLGGTMPAIVEQVKEWGQAKKETTGNGDEGKTQIAGAEPVSETKAVAICRTSNYIPVMVPVTENPAKNLAAPVQKNRIITLTIERLDENNNMVWGQAKKPLSPARSKARSNRANTTPCQTRITED